MGLVYLSIPEPYMLFLQKLINAKTLVETGTYTGRSTVIASKYFDTVHTIELSQPMYEGAKQTYADVPNIHFHLGHTVDKLREIIPQLDTPTIFWLDAHYFPDTDIAGEDEECPLLNEIAVINQMELPQIIMIDDARYFLGVPPVEHNASHWPSLQQVLNALDPTGSERYTICMEDVIMSVPIAYKNLVQYTLSRIKPPATQAA